MMKINITQIFVFFLACAAIADNRLVSLQTELERELQSGSISQAEYVAYRIMGIINHPGLPSAYRDYPRDLSRMGTSLMMEARFLLDVSSGRDRDLLHSVLSRPDDLPLSKISPSGRFKLHYTDAGSNAAADTFITQSALAYDQVYDIIIQELGYDPPPIDETAEPEYDVYVHSVGGYGLSIPESPAPSDKYPHGYTSYISMDNEFKFTYTKGVDGMLVTAAHEFFHMVQLGMRTFSSTEIDSRWLFEGTAVWMEDYAYDEINDYVQYLPHYMSSLNKSFHTFNGLHEYGSCIFYHMLEAKYGADIIKAMWSEFANQSMWEALDSALRREGSSFAAELADHMVWNYFTGIRAAPELYYPEGELYPMIQPDYIYEIEESLGFSEETDYLSAHYIKVEPTTFGDLYVAPTMASPAHWLYSVIDDPVTSDVKSITSAGSGSVFLPQVSSSHEITIIPTNIYMPENDYARSEDEYSFNVSLGEVENFRPGIQRIHPNPFQPAVHSGGLKIDVRLTEKTKRIIYTILNENGFAVYTKRVQFDSALNGDFSLYWDGRSSEKEFVASGIYLVYIDAGQEIEPGKIAVIR